MHDFYCAIPVHIPWRLDGLVSSALLNAVETQTHLFSIHRVQPQNPISSSRPSPFMHYSICSSKPSQLSSSPL